MGWGVTTSDVEQTTGRAVTSVNLAMAEGSVEIYSNRTPAASADMRSSDLHWIQTAIKWQAAWLADQPDYTARQQVQTIDQDGVKVEYSKTGSGVNAAVTLAPLAIRALKNLSWKAGGTTEVPHARTRLGQVDLTQEPYDPYNRWYQS